MHPQGKFLPSREGREVNCLKDVLNLYKMSGERRGEWCIVNFLRGGDILWIFLQPLRNNATFWQEKSTNSSIEY